MFGASRRERFGYCYTSQCRDGTQPYARRSPDARPRRTLLPIASPRLGRCNIGIEGRSAKSLGNGPISVGLAQKLSGIFQRHTAKNKKVRQRRTIRNFQQRILGTSSLQVTSRSQSHRSCTLPRSTGSTERHRKNPNDFRREKSSPQLPRRRYGLRRKYQRPECPES